MSFGARHRVMICPPALSCVFSGRKGGEVVSEASTPLGVAIESSTDELGKMIVVLLVGRYRNFMEFGLIVYEGYGYSSNARHSYGRGCGQLCLQVRGLDFL